MANPDKERLMALVESETGYRVELGTTDEVSSDAQMISAGPGHPYHIVNISKRCLSNADYITSIQCQMLLLMWSHPSGVPSIQPRQKSLQKMVEELSSWKGYVSLPREAARSVANNLATGLLHQLVSTPSEILAIEACYRDCPSLRDQQSTSLHATFRNNTGALRPENKNMIPPTVLEASTAMCAVLALVWARLTGDAVALIPYRAIGAESKAQELLALFDATVGMPGERRVAAVDAWAHHLKLTDLYDWSYR